MTDELVRDLLQELKGLRRDLRKLHPEIWPPVPKEAAGGVVAVAEVLPRTLRPEHEEAMEFNEQRATPWRRRR